MLPRNCWRLPLSLPYRRSLQTVPASSPKRSPINLRIKELATPQLASYAGELAAHRQTKLWLRTIYRHLKESKCMKHMRPVTVNRQLRFSIKSATSFNNSLARVGSHFNNLNRIPGVELMVNLVNSARTIAHLNVALRVMRGIRWFMRPAKEEYGTAFLVKTMCLFRDKFGYSLETVDRIIKFLDEASSERHNYALCIGPFFVQKLWFEAGSRLKNFTSGVSRKEAQERVLHVTKAIASLTTRMHFGALNEYETRLVNNALKRYLTIAAKLDGAKADESEELLVDNVPYSQWLNKSLEAL